ncbi:MAG: hypothetical protein HZB43_08025 [candidate division Zixibacteria bacterium]|nr:hypothetical protein [candidate division Zixibacteria bacterium]
MKSKLPGQRADRMSAAPSCIHEAQTRKPTPPCQRRLFAGIASAAIACAILGMGCSRESASPRVSNHISLQKVSTAQGANSVMSLEIGNTTPVAALSVVIGWNPAIARFDSVSWNNGRAKSIAVKTATADPVLGRVLLAVLPLTEPAVAPGEGAWATLYFTAVGSSGTSTAIDSTRYYPRGRTQMIDAQGRPIAFEFLKGQIDIK